MTSSQEFLDVFLLFHTVQLCEHFAISWSMGTVQGCHFPHVVARGAPLNGIHLFYPYL